MSTVRFAESGIFANSRFRLQHRVEKRPNLGFIPTTYDGHMRAVYAEQGRTPADLAKAHDLMSRLSACEHSWAMYQNRWSIIIRQRLHQFLTETDSEDCQWFFGYLQNVIALWTSDGTHRSQPVAPSDGPAACLRDLVLPGREADDEGGPAFEEACKDRLLELLECPAVEPIARDEIQHVRNLLEDVQTIFSSEASQAHGFDVAKATFDHISVTNRLEESEVLLRALELSYEYATKCEAQIWGTSNYAPQLSHLEELLESLPEVDGYSAPIRLAGGSQAAIFYEVGRMSRTWQPSCSTLTNEHIEHLRSEDAECGICKDVFLPNSEVLSLTHAEGQGCSGSTLHGECIRSWYTSSGAIDRGEFKCPYCRQEVPAVAVVDAGDQICEGHEIMSLPSVFENKRTRPFTVRMFQVAPPESIEQQASDLDSGMVAVTMPTANTMAISANDVTP